MSEDNTWIRKPANRGILPHQHTRGFAFHAREPSIHTRNINGAVKSHDMRDS